MSGSQIRWSELDRSLLIAFVVAALLASGCGVRGPTAASPPPRATPNAQPAKPSAPVAPAESKPQVLAEAEEPATPRGTAKAGTAKAGTAKKPTGSQPTKPVAPATEELIGAPRTSLATGSGTLPAALLANKFELRDALGKQKYSFKNKGDDAVKFYDAAGVELCKLTVSTDKLKIKSPDDKPLFELKHKSDKSSLRLPPDEREAWKFKPRGERLEISTADDRLAYVVRRDAAAVMFEKSTGELVCRAERKGGSTTLTDAAGKTLLIMSAAGDPLALVFFGWTELSPSQQAACLVFYLRKSSS